MFGGLCGLLSSSLELEEPEKRCWGDVGETVSISDLSCLMLEVLFPRDEVGS